MVLRGDLNALGCSHFSASERGRFKMDCVDLQLDVGPLEDAEAAAACILEQLEECEMQPDEGVTGIPEFQGLTTYSIGALLDRPCMDPVPTPLAPFMIDTGSIARPYSIDAPGPNDVECVHVTQGNNHWKYEFSVTAELLTEASYNGRFPILKTVEKSTIDFELDYGGDTNYQEDYSDTFNIGNSGAEKAACEQALSFKLFEARAAAFEWVDENLATAEGISAELTMHLIQMADGSWLVEILDCESDIVEFNYDAVGAWQFEAFFNCIALTLDSNVNAVVHAHGSSAGLVVSGEDWIEL